MSDMNDYMEDKVLNVFFRGQTYTGIATHVALYTANPTDAGGGTECAYAGYARVNSGATPSTAWTAPSGGSISNAALLQFVAVAGGSISVTGFALLDASTGGNFLMWKSLAAPLAFNVGDIPQFPIGGIVVTMA